MKSLKLEEAGLFYDELILFLFFLQCFHSLFVSDVCNYNSQNQLEGLGFYSEGPYLTPGPDITYAEPKFYLVLLTL